MAKRTSLKNAVLTTLTRRQKRGATTKELANVGGIRYSARICELRDEGYVIDRSPIKGKPGNFRYRLIPLF